MFSLKYYLDMAQDALKCFCDSNCWEWKVDRDRYPMTFTYTKSQGSFFNEDDEIPFIKFIFTNDILIEMNIPEGEIINETFLNKIKNLTKEYHRLQLLYWFEQKESRFNNSVSYMNKESDVLSELWPLKNGNRLVIINNRFCDDKHEFAVIHRDYKP